VRVYWKGEMERGIKGFGFRIRIELNGNEF
jgi:hypothetical protein